MGAEQIPGEKERARDRVMIDALCAKGVAMWTPGELRELLCEAVGNVIDGVRGKGSVNVQQMIETAVAAAKQKAEAANYPHKVKWDSTGQCFLRNLIAAEVLLDEKRAVIRNHWTAGAKNVCDLAEDWTLKVDGALVMAILRNVENVTLSDEFSLALSLYQRGQDRGLKTTELHAKIAVVIEFLEQTG